jgi:hypothetical protein
VLAGLGIALHRIDPGARGGHQLGVAVDQRVHEAQLLRLGRAEELAFQQVGLRGHQAELARHLGDAAAAGDQAQRDLGQAELRLGVVHRDAVMAHQRHLPAAAQRRAVQAAHHRLAEGLDDAEVLLDALDLDVDARGVLGLHAHHALEVGAREKGALGRGQDDAADGVLVLGHLGRHGVQVVLPLQAHGVDGRVLLVEGDDGDAVLDAVLDGLEFHGNGFPEIQMRSTMVAMPMPPPTHSVARP